MSKIVISYRREDSQETTGRIYDRLTSHFPPGNVFRDVDNIPPGTDFRHVLEWEVGSCDVLLAIIGHRWLKVTDANGQRRLDDLDDFVRIEIETALRRDIPVIPVLVSNAPMPEAQDLPPAIRDLAYRNGRVVRPDPDFHRDMARR